MCSLGRLGRRSPEHGPNPGDQLGHLKGLGDVIVSAGLQADHDVDGVRAGRQHDDGHAAVLADLPTHLEAVERRQHDVEEHDVEGVPSGPQEAVPPIPGGGHPETRTLQADRGHFPDRWVVLHQQYPFIHR